MPCQNCDINAKAGSPEVDHGSKYDHRPTGSKQVSVHRKKKPTEIIFHVIIIKWQMVTFAAIATISGETAVKITPT